MTLNFPGGEWSMSTEFMFLFCSKCKRLSYQIDKPILIFNPGRWNCNENTGTYIAALYAENSVKLTAGGQEKAPPLTVSLARGAWGWSNAHMSAVIRRQNLSELEGARPFDFRAYINCRQSTFSSTVHHSLRKDASATKIDCAFICMKARQCSQVDSCSFTSLPDFPASCEPLADIASSLRNTSSHQRVIEVCSCQE